MNIPTPDQFAKNAAKELAACETRLMATLGAVDASMLMACYSLCRLADLNSDSSKYSRPAPVAIELAAWILFPHFGKSQSADPAHIQSAIDTLEDYQRAYSFAEMFPLVEEGQERDSLGTHLRLHAGLVRGSGYPSQVEGRIQAVLGPLESELASIAGIGPLRATKIAKAILEQMDDNINTCRKRILELFERGCELAKEGIVGNADLEQVGIQFHETLAGMGGNWVPTMAQISLRLGGVQNDEWQAFTAAVGLTPSTRSSIRRVVDVQDRPVFFLDSNRAFAIHIVAVLDAIFCFFDDLSRSSTLLRDRYGKLVADWMESETVGYLKRIFPSQSVIRGACYSDPDNPGGEVEADAVIVWGPFLVVAESKGKRVDRNAIRGGFQKLRAVLSKNIQDAFIQARRVIRTLENDGTIRIKEKTSSRVVEVKADELRRILPISITLQHLSGIPTQLAATQQLGLFKGKAYPWSVCIDDLDVITRFAKSPDVFLHYIERRIAHQGLDIGLSGDELDIFGQYLDNRLHPCIYEERQAIAEHDGPRFIAFDGGEERFEPFYLARWYGDPPPEKTVELQVPVEIHAILNELRSRPDNGARWIAFALLGLSQPALNRLSSAVKKLRLKQAEGQRMLRITICENEIVVNVLAHRGLSKHEFFKNMTFRTRLEHYRAKARASVSIGIDQREEKTFEIAQWFEGEWEHEEAMEKLLEADREQPRAVHLPKNASKPGRNDLCPCGSGRKIKKCCRDRIIFHR